MTKYGTVYILLLFIAFWHLYNCKDCNQPLGMESGKITDSQLRGSPTDGASGTTSKDARYNGSKGWCVINAKGTSHFKDNTYLEIDLGSLYHVSGIKLQRSADDRSNYKYGGKFQLQYAKNASNPFTVYKTTNKYNAVLTKGDTATSEAVMFDRFLEARYLRWFPSMDENPKCVRMEILGCKGPIGEPTPVPTQNLATMPTGSNSVCSSSILDQSFNNDDYFKESSYLKGDSTFPGKFLLYTSPFGWCPDNRQYKDTDPPYKEWVSIDLRQKYKVTAVVTSGFTKRVGNFDNLYQIGIVRLEFGVEPSKWTYYTVNGAIETFSGSSGTKFILQNPFVARYVKISPKITTNKTQCLKLQLYGCKSTDIPATSAPIAPTTPVASIGSTQPPAVIKFYSVYQGSKWKGLRFSDEKYSGILGKGNVLQDGVGILTDGVTGKDGPMRQPQQWLGWTKGSVSQPTINVTFSRKVQLSDIRLTMFVSKKEEMALFDSVDAYFDHSQKAAALHRCMSGKARNAKDGNHIVALEFSDVEVEKIMLTFKYQKEWLMVSEISFNKGFNGALVFTMSKAACKVTMPKGEDGGVSPAVIAGSCIALLVLIILIVLVLLRRKTRFRRRRAEKGNESKQQEMKLIKSMTDNPIYDQNKQGSGYTEVYVDNDNREPLLEKDPVYAAPDIDSHVKDDVTAGYSAIEDLNRLPGQDVSYAEPGSPAQQDDIQFNPIYEQTYENPYKAVTGSSMYADPEQQSGRRSFEIKRFPRESLRFIEKIGSGQFGEVIICEVDRLREILGPDMGYCGPDRALVAVKTLKAGVDHSVQKEFMKEVRVMARLEHENVVNLLGVCDDEPKCMVVEYMENGDLNQFLKDSKRYEGPNNPRVSQLPRDVILVDTLMYMAMQVSSGMNYLSSHGFIHRDLATRNCLVGPAFTVKISDFGMSRYLYSKQYYRIEGKAILPIRWMAPESLFYGKFTSYTDVWAFGVTIWEIFSYARETPYCHMTDQQVIDNACLFVQERRKLFQHLRQPKDCPGDVYNVMMQCWAKTPEDRPTFEAIHSFFSQIVESQEGSI